jgi:hypothetical protein
MSAAPALDTAPDPIMGRLEDQIAWYDRHSRRNRRAYQWLKIAEIVAAAVIPFLAGFHVPYAGVLTGALGVVITAFEGILQLNHCHENWISYRATAESLKHEKYLFLARATPYTNAADPRAMLAERVESLVSQESTKWALAQQQEIKVK